MSEVNELIRRARELAALADKATPPPWKCRHVSGNERRDSDWGALGIFSESAKTLVCGDGDGWDAGFVPPNEADAALIEAAHEMARLLRQLADELEDWHRWARNWCKHHCEGFRPYGRHYPNCPVADMIGKED